MIYGNIDEMPQYPAFKQHPVWRTAFAELAKVSTHTAPGTYPTCYEGCFVKVLDYQTLPREKCRYETHIDHLDLQYTIRGGELIDWESRGELVPAGPFDAKGDVQFYQPHPARTVLHLLPRHYAIFFPLDAHRPQVHDGTHDSVFKVVVKIRLDLISHEKSQTNP